MTSVLPADLRAPFFRGHTWKRVKNVSGVTIPPFSIVLASSPTTNAGEIVIPVIQPNSASTDWNWNQYLVVGPIALGVSDTTNEGYASDLTEPGFLRYDGSGTPAAKQIWGPKHGQFTASLGYYGYEILGGNTTAAGNNVTIAKWVGCPVVIGKIDDASVTLGGTCTVSVMVGTTYQTDSTMNITGVVNRGVALTSLSTPYCGVSQGNGNPILMWVAC